jgi:hypothetical protein
MIDEEMWIYWEMMWVGWDGMKGFGREEVVEIGVFVRL